MFIYIMVDIFILGVSLIGALVCAIGIKFFAFHNDTKIIEYTPMDNSNLENVVQEIPPKYEAINLVN
jgi:hypothetical protein